MMKKRGLALLAVLLLLVSSALPLSAARDDGAPTGVRLRSGLIIQVDETRRIGATVTPSTATDTSLTWRSSDERIVTVNDGFVTGVTAGRASVYATTSNGHTSSCSVTVRGNQVKAEKLEMGLDKMTVRVGSDRQLWVHLTPVDTTQDNVIWKSSDNDVATVNGRGIVTGVAAGSATITASVSDKATATCKVTVTGTGGAKTSTGDEKVPTTATGTTLSAAEARSGVKAAALTTLRQNKGIAGFSGKSEIAPDAIQAAVATATELRRDDIRLRFRTRDAEGYTQSFLTFDPRQASDRTQPLQTEVTLDSDAALSASRRFEKFYQNRVEIIHCREEGAYGFPVEIAVKADLTGMDSSNLHFYSYNLEDNTYRPLSIASSYVNSSGFLVFSTDTGGLLVVSDGVLG